MLSLLALFTTFRGRIGRKQWWIGFLILMAVSLPVEAYLDPDLFSVDQTLRPPTLPDTVWSILMLIPSTAITVTRLNDRNRPWWLAYALSGAWLFTFVSPYFGVYVDPDAGTANAVTFWMLLAASLAVTIDNGFLRGTSGPNRYGDNPIVPPGAASAAVT